MYGFNSANHLVPLFTGAAPYPKISHSSRRSLVGISQIVCRSKRSRKREKKLETPSKKCESSRSYERRVLPPELSRNVAVLTCESAADGGVCDVYLVGTCHVSTESCQEVQAVIEFLKPQVVFVELCSSRVGILALQNFKVPTMGEMVDMWKNKENIFRILCSWLLAKVASELEVLPGAEFRVAYEEAMKYGAKVILGDRPVQITLQRTWAKMPLWHMTIFLFAFPLLAVFFPSPEDLTEMVKEMVEDDVDSVTQAFQELSKMFPTVAETLVHERDQYMSAVLLKVARKHNSVVAVVGKGHLPGIQKNWKQAVEVKQLLSMPIDEKKDNDSEQGT